MNIHGYYRYFFLLVALFISVHVFAWSIKTKAYNDSLTQRLRGFILLQVEDHGEAWYVDPTSDARIYMRDGSVAYDVMANLGLGITNADLAKIKVGIEDRFECHDSDGDGLCDKLEEGLKTDLYDSDSDNDSYNDRVEVLSGYDPLGVGTLSYDYNLADRLRGRIVLQVEERGQAWYINPQDGLRYYMKDGPAAYQIMRFLSLGITNQDLTQIPVSNYSLVQDDDSSNQVTDNCGNGILESGEECDGNLGLTFGYHCTDDCKLEEEAENDEEESSDEEGSVCGNYVLEGSEECDGLQGLIEGYECVNCQLVEEDDDSSGGGDNGGSISVCGNGILESGEECDGAQGVTEGYQCNTECILEEVAPSIEYSMNILQPYDNKNILAHSDVPEGSTYSWDVDGNILAGIVPTIFLAHFDGNLDTVNQENLVYQENVSFESAKFGQGMKGKVEYPMADNLDLDKGTIDFWLKLNQAPDHSVFDSDPYFFRYTNESMNDNFYFRVHSANHLTFTIYDHSKGWSNAVQLGTRYYEILPNEWMYFTMLWSKDDGVAKFYLNGEQIARKEYEDNFPDIQLGNENFIIGNNNAVLDEFRIMNQMLSTDEIRENYKRGIAPSASDIFYPSEVSSGQDINLIVETDQGDLEESSTVLSEKINVSNPGGYFVPYTSTLSINFSTPDSMDCRYDYEPGFYDDLNYQASGFGTSHSISQVVSGIVEQYPIYIKCKASSGTGDDYGFFRQYRILPNIDNNYPKISKLWWGDSVNEDEVDYLAKFDLLNVSKSNVTHPSVMKQIKEINPNIILMPYKGAITHQDYPAVEFKSLAERIDTDWRLQSSEIPDLYCVNHYFSNNLVYNLNSTLPYVAAVAEHMEKDIFDRESYFDGIWWDVTGPDFWFLREGGSYDDFCDFDLDGTDEDLNVYEDLIIAKEVWRDGMHQQMQLTRDRLGHDMFSIGNGNSPDHADYNGKLWEENFDAGTFDMFFDPDHPQSFFYWQEHSLEPHMNENLFSNLYSAGYSSHYRYHRYGMAASLMAGLYYNPTTYDNNRLVNWFEEYWVDKLNAQPTDDPDIGRGYLGRPLAEAYIDSNGIWRRDFANGIVLLNHNNFAVTAGLKGQFRFIDGTEDAAANPGGKTESVEMNYYDGRILLRTLCGDNPYNDPLCIK